MYRSVKEHLFLYIVDTSTVLYMFGTQRTASYFMSKYRQVISLIKHEVHFPGVSIQSAAYTPGIERDLGRGERDGGGGERESCRDGWRCV